MGLKDQFVRLARYNRWANERLFGAMRSLSAEAFHAPRSGFFGSLCGTLNHLYVGDRCWLARFEQIPVPHRQLDEIPHPLFDHLWSARQVEDHRTLRLLDAAKEEWFQGILQYRSIVNGKELSMPMDVAMLHFFNHQTHHRGQAHAMLSSTDVPPPDLDITYFYDAETAR